MKKKPSYFEVSENRLNDIKYIGFNYKGRIFEKTLSKVITSDKKRSEILKKIESLIYFALQKVKSIKTHINFTVKKDYTDFN